jgi:CheY-like chemotaxis protein
MILLDLYMPKLDGFEVLSFVKKDEQLPAVRQKIQSLLLFATRAGDLHPE